FHNPQDSGNSFESPVISEGEHHGFFIIRSVSCGPNGLAVNIKGQTYGELCICVHFVIPPSHIFQHQRDKRCAFGDMIHMDVFVRRMQIESRHSHSVNGGDPGSASKITVAATLADVSNLCNTKLLCKSSCHINQFLIPGQHRLVNASLDFQAD